MTDFDAVKFAKENNVIDAINSAYAKGAYVGRREGINQGRADKYQEITSKYMLFTKEQISDMKIDVIDEVEKILLNRFANDDFSDWLDADIREAIRFELEQLRRQI